MTNFAGTLNGQVIEEQLFLNNQWVTYRTRGGAVQQERSSRPPHRRRTRTTPPSSTRWTSAGA